MTDLAKVRINLSSGEIEIQGSEEFVERQLENLETIIETVGFLAPTDEENNLTEDEQIEKETQEEVEKSSTGTDDLSVPDNFGEWLHKFPRELSENDLALLTGYYVQRNSEDSDFKTLDVNKHLKEQGIKLSNTSRAAQRLAEAKQTFVTRKKGRMAFYRVSRDGKVHLKSLLSQ